MRLCFGLLNRKSMTILGSIYEEKGDMDLSIKYYRMAAKKGCTVAKEELKRLGAEL